MSGLVAKAGDERAPTQNEVREQLERVVLSPDFRLPERGRRFLRFIIEETLSGRSCYLKAYTVAQEVFGRNTSFDAQNDPCVRIEAGRIRRALEHYYLTGGSSDKIAITVPRGGYVPVFSIRHDGDEAESGIITGDPALVATSSAKTLPRKSKKYGTPLIIGGAFVFILGGIIFAFLVERPDTYSSPQQVASEIRPTVSVERFTVIGQYDRSSDISEGVEELITANLVKSQKIVVLIPEEAREADVVPVYTLQGSVRIYGRKSRFVARLIRDADNVLVWSGNYDADLDAQSAPDLQARIANRVTTAIAASLGVASAGRPKQSAGQ